MCKDYFHNRDVDFNYKQKTGEKNSTMSNHIEFFGP